LNEKIARVLRWLIVIVMPFFLGFTAIELAVNNAEYYLAYEYGKASFPEDLQRVNEITRQQLGLRPFSEEQRQELALVAVDYLQRPEPAEEVIYLLEDQQLPGSNEPLYNASEISHMVDVKHVTDGIGRLNRLAALVVLGGMAILLLSAGTRPVAFRALFQGGLLTMFVLLAIGLFILLAWSTFFVEFHELLFPPDTWSFAYSDSLIRLFPEKFWFDFGVLLSLLAFLLGALATVVGWVLKRR
jgi:integral membrane protein (TIGR01906 family)